VEQIIILTVLAATGIYVQRQCRRLQRQLADAEARADELGALLALEQETAYRLACQLYGRQAVDRAIQGAHDKGKN
jgi:hypothetical protein